MSHSRSTNKNKLHKLTLRIVYGDYRSAFDQLLEKDHTFAKHLAIYPGVHSILLNIDPELFAL